MTSPRRLIVSRRAGADIRSILRYSFREWGAERRERYRAQIDRTIDELLAFPELGPTQQRYSRDMEGVRSRLAGEHVILYRFTNDSLIILRVVHQRMNVSGGLDTSD